MKYLAIEQELIQFTMKIILKDTLIDFYEKKELKSDILAKLDLQRDSIFNDVASSRCTTAEPFVAHLPPP
jgi:hypothetical protein